MHRQEDRMAEMPKGYTKGADRIHQDRERLICVGRGISLGMTVVVREVVRLENTDS